MTNRKWEAPAAWMIGFVAGLIPAAASAIVSWMIISTQPREADLVEVPPCDTRVNGSRAGAQLRARMAAGVEMTACDIDQLDGLIDLVEEWEEDFDRCSDCENELTWCQWGHWDVENCRRYQEMSRIDAAIDLLDGCAGND
jgi:hypothetical protein